MTVSTEEGKHESFIKNVALAKGDVIKLWSGDDKYYGCSKGVEHNLTVGISTDTKLRDSVDNYVACEAANFDVYAKFDANGKYIGMYIHDQAARAIYCEANWGDINSGKMWAHYWGDNVIGSVFDYKPQMVYDHKTGYNKDCNKVVIPGAATSIKFCYNKTTGEFVESENQTLGENNAYFFDNWNEGTPKMGSYKYSA